MKQPYLRQFICKTSITFLVIILTFGSNTISNTFAQDISPDSLLQQQTPPPGNYVEYVNEYFSIEHTTMADGTAIQGYIINGPPEPLAEFAAEREASILPLPSRGVISDFPSYDWVFGCSAVSGAMIAAYYDRSGYPNMYTGPTNGGVMPITDASWPTWSDTFMIFPSNPLVASRIGVDGRTTRGSIEDYWVSYNSSSPDPYITNGWVQHAWGSAIGDYMKTSQSTYGSKDGSTWFYNYNSNQKLTCDTSQYYNNPDGTLGRKLFYEARGYTVTDCYNQNTDNNYVGGFSLANFQAEIDSGHPVLLNLAGHSIVGYGYSGSTIYIRDTWDSNPSNTYTMEWGGSYEDMTLLSVSVVHLASLPVNQPPTDINLSKSTVLEGQSVNTVVGTFSTVDPNAGDTFTYALVSGTGDGDNASFNISGSSLRTSAVFDYNVKNTYSIRVLSTDSGGLFFEESFTITVLEVGAERFVYLPLIMNGPKASQTLLNQPLYGSEFYACQDFETINDEYDIYLADDFIVPSSGWNITEIFIPGDLWNGATSLTQASTIHFMIYGDQGGIPASYPGVGSPMWRLDLLPTDPQVTLSNSSSGYPSNVTLKLNTPVHFNEGRYWLLFYPSLSFNSFGQYGRFLSDTANGYDAMLINPGGGLDLPTTWTSIQSSSTWGLAQQDLAFTIKGTQ